ncbi:molybdopterin-synthase adenylyltransferase MoeB [Alisedimentitalea sp. MJ-SS2]|uniref:HesA/MoeB/ThiF family protein n=1 Tax=Aliisedimentitalea sp. MJ-SS2 TaxID=3049795 RepID=UPI00291549F7|nr:molybdopterin-synthase adenylyltransferase MoeB [Alisedimentitalea sp. MJ-SS2]MDU8928821.1 molybdopterin-synthase adenylyltransferase MoeB [Alisedimentitalea sp. MJ-SS2]
MLLVFGIAAMIWGLGRLMRWPGQMVWVLIVLLWLAVMLIQLTLPEGHELRVATGESPVLWGLIGGFAVAVALYAKGLAWLRARAVVQEEVPVSEGMYSEVELGRYARHIVLRELGGPGQKKLKAAKVLVVGAGGLGSPVLLYLAAAGVGTIGVVDDDEVDGSNLQRQVIHSDDRIGMPKVHSAAGQMRALNPFVEVKPYHRRLEEATARELFAEYDVVIDGTDNFDTRYMVNRTCVATGKPLISGAITQWEGQLSVFEPGAGAPCYQCVFPEAPAADLAPSCAQAGVVGPLPGVIGTMMALEAVKLIADAGHVLRGELLIYDGLWGESRKIAVKRRDDCPVCGEGGTV